MLFLQRTDMIINAEYARKERLETKRNLETKKQNPLVHNYGFLLIQSGSLMNQKMRLNPKHHKLETDPNCPKLSTD